MSAAVSGQWAGVLVCAGAGLLAAPYLARLTLTVPDRENPAWWRGAPAGRGRLLVTGLAAGGLGVLAGLAAGWSALLPAYLALTLFAAPLVVVDYEHHRLPDRLVRPLAASALLLLAAAALVRDDWSAYLRALEGAAAVFAVLYLLAFISPRSFGFGDVKLGGVLGLYLGWSAWIDVYYGVFAGFLIGALLALALLATRRASLKSHIAFGPMLVIGPLLVLAFDLAPSLG